VFSLHPISYHHPEAVCRLLARVLGGGSETVMLKGATVR
jgi:hypothetical protein